MRKSLLFFLILLSQKNLLAQLQNPTENRKMVDQATGTFLYFSQYTDVQGNPFLFDQWLPGILVMKSGSEQMEREIKLEVFNNKFIVNRNDTAFEVSPMVTEVRLFKSGNKPDTIVFRKGFTGKPKVNPNTFVQILATSGNSAFIKIHRKELDEVTEYNNADKVKRFRAMQEYAISNGTDIQIVKLSKSDLLQALAEKESELADFLAAQKLNARDEKTWITVFRHFDQP